MKNRKSKKPTAQALLRAVNATRRNNLRKLVGEGKQFASQADLALALGESESYLSQLIGANPIRRVTESTARKFEYALDLRAGALDVAG